MINTRKHTNLTIYSAFTSDRGLEVLVFPSKKSSDTNKKDRSVSIDTKQQNVSKLKTFSSVTMNGASTHPLYKYLRTNSVLYNTMKHDCALVNNEYTKFLVDRFGNVVRMYNPNADEKEIEHDIENLLTLT